MTRNPHSHPAHRNVPDAPFEPMRDDDHSEAAERSRRWMKELDEPKRAPKPSRFLIPGLHRLRPDRSHLDD